MCDYSLHGVKTRPAKLGEKLTTHAFDQGAGRVLRSATRIARKRSWAAIMLRRRLKTQSKCSVPELGS